MILAAAANSIPSDNAPIWGFLVIAVGLISIFMHRFEGKAKVTKGEVRAYKGFSLVLFILIGVAVYTIFVVNW